MNRIAALLFAGAILCLGSANHPAVAGAQPAATMTPSAAPPASPTAAPNTTPPQPAASTTPMADYNFVYRPTPSPSATPVAAPGAPQIDEIDLSDATIVAPGTIRVRVLTSTAVTSVTADAFGRTMAIPQQQPGLFALVGTIPDVPFFLKNRVYNIEFVAAVPDGRTTRVTLPLTLR